MSTKNKEIKLSTGFVLLVGNKPVKGYITAVLVALKSNIDTVIIKARGRCISKAVDVAEILKRFEDPKFSLLSMEIGTTEMKETTDESGAVYKEPRVRRVSSIEINLTIKKA